MTRLWLKLVVPTAGLFVLIWLVSTWIYDTYPRGIDPVPVAFNPLRPHAIALSELDRDGIVRLGPGLEAAWNMRIAVADPPPLSLIGVSDSPIRVLSQGGTLGWTIEAPGHPPILARVRTVDAGLAEVYVPMRDGAWGRLDLGDQAAAALRASQAWEQRQDAIVVTLLLVAAVAMVGGLGWYLTWRLRRLRGCFQRLHDGDLGARVDARGGDVIDQLGRSCNAMADRLQGLISQQDDLLRMLAHELRTPLARMDLGLHLAGTEGASSPRLAAVRSEIERLDGLVQDLTRLIRVGTLAASEMQQPVDLGGLLDEVVAQAQAAHPAINCTASAPSGLIVHHHPALLRIAVGNLVANAVRHAVSAVEVGASADAGQMRIWVDDDGPGVPVGDRQRIFQPFVSLTKGGCGLGLTIATRVMETCDGTAACTDAPLGGARFVLSWPAHQAA